MPWAFQGPHFSFWESGSDRSDRQTLVKRSRGIFVFEKCSLKKMSGVRKAGSDSSAQKSKGTSLEKTKAGKAKDPGITKRGNASKATSSNKTSEYDNLGYISSLPLPEKQEVSGAGENFTDSCHVCPRTLQDVFSFVEQTDSLLILCLGLAACRRAATEDHGTTNRTSSL